MGKGKIIVIDGLDGSGKNTQTTLTHDWLEAEGYPVIRASFPEYKSWSSILVKWYLKGRFGKDPMKVNPYIASSFYAIDRFIQYHTRLKQYYKSGDIILCDRYLSANIIHQASKLPKEKRKAFYKWVYKFETGFFRIPKETVTIVLSVPPQISQKLMSERYKSDEAKKDIHESNIKYLEACFDNANYASDVLNWTKIDCTDANGELKSRDEIFEEIKDRLVDYL